MNELLRDHTMGGGRIGGHALVLSLNHIRHFLSFEEFRILAIENHDAVSKDIGCMEDFKVCTKVQQVRNTKVKHTYVLIKVQCCVCMVAFSAQYAKSHRNACVQAKHHHASVTVCPCV